MTSKVWTESGTNGWIVESVGEEWAIYEPSGQLRGRYRDGKMMAGHLALALERIDALEKQLESARQALR